jgi:hypothetical protein
VLREGVVIKFIITMAHVYGRRVAGLKRDALPFYHALFFANRLEPGFSAVLIKTL